MGRTVAAWFMIAGALASTAPGPREVVEIAVTQVLAALQEADLGQPEEPRATVRHVSRARAEIRRVAAGLFDVEEMARRTLSRHWTRRTPGERAEFVALFTAVLERAYVTRLETYAGERVVFGDAVVDGPYALVPTRLVEGPRRETPVDYRLRLRDGRWRVYDVLIDGVSFVASYRRQFDAIIRKESYRALADRLRQREVATSSPTPVP